MLFEVAVFLNDVHLELEDDDHDVIHVDVGIPPLSFKVVMKKLRMTKLKVLNTELDEDDCLEDQRAESDVVEVVHDVANAMDIVVEDDLVEEDVEVVEDVVNLNVDNVVDRPDHDDVELYDADVQ